MRRRRVRRCARLITATPPSWRPYGNRSRPCTGGWTGARRRRAYMRRLDALKCSTPYIVPLHIPAGCAGKR